MIDPHEQHAFFQGEVISLSCLAKLTGFPVEYIKSELLINEDEISVSGLRDTVMSYLVENQDDFL